MAREPDAVVVGQGDAGPPSQAPLAESSAVRSSAAVKMFIALALTHTVVDCGASIWAMFKKLAGLDLERAGMLATIAGTLAFLMHPVFGVVADHGYRRRLILLGGALSGSVFLLGPLSRASFLDQWSGFAVMFLLLFGTVIGGAMFHPPAVSLARNSNLRRPSTAVALFITFGMAGMTSGPYLFSTIWFHLDRHSELLLLTTAVILMLVFRWCRIEESRDHRPLGLGLMIRRLAAVPAGIIPLWLISVMVCANQSALVFLMPEFAAERGLPTPIVNGLGHAALMAGSVVMMVPVGHLGDRFGRRRVIAAVLVLAVPAYGALVLTPHPSTWLFLAMVFLCGGLSGASGPLAITHGHHLMNAFPSVATGIMMGLAWAAASPITWVAGRFGKAEHLGPAGALRYVGLTLIVAVAMSLFVPSQLKVRDGHQ